jgi:hypothetical protein
VLGVPQIAALASTPQTESTHVVLEGRLKLPSLTPKVIAHSFHAVINVDSSYDATSSPSDCYAGHSAGTCTLRDAIERANADAPHVDEVIVPSGRHITLTQNDIGIYENMVISGTGAVVNANGNQGLYVSNNPSVEINGLTVAYGDANYGGAIDCYNGSLQLVGVTVRNSAALSGGGIYGGSGCQMWIGSSTISSNVATDSGGGIYNEGPTVITNSTIGGAASAQGNYSPAGGGIYNEGGSDVINNSSIKYNTTDQDHGYGAGVYNDEVMSISNSAISFNHMGLGGQGGGIYNAETLQISNSYVNSNAISGGAEAYGAGLYDEGYSATLKNVNFVGNSNKVPNWNIAGGAVYSSSQNFTWNGGTISSTTNGIANESDSIYGGALYSSASHTEIANVGIYATNNDSRPSGNIVGGAAWFTGNVSLNNDTVASTTNRAGYIQGGAVNFDSGCAAAMTNTNLEHTTNTASLSSGGAIEGGAAYNSSRLVVNNVAMSSTQNTANNAPASSPSSTSSSVEGGALYSGGIITGNGLSINSGSSVASGGHGSVDGGAFLNEHLSTVTNMQILNFHVTADQSVEGGLVSNLDVFSATNFTLGDSTIKVLGGPDATGPYADGAVLYSDSQANFVNATIANNSTSVASGGGHNWVVENSASMGFSDSTLADNALTGLSGANTGLILSLDGDVATFSNSIVAGALAWRTCVTLGSGKIHSLGNNIDNGTTCRFYMPGDLQNTSPKVLALANNGGSVQTAALKNPGSPAINHGNNATCSSSDARGVSRPQHKTCDIGAYEVV